MKQSVSAARRGVNHYRIGLVALFLVSAVLVPAGSNPAQAFPKYAKKEKKPCAYCHVNAAGGGKRTAAGIYYATHNLSLVGFAPTGTAKKPSKPAKPGAAKKVNHPHKA